LSNKIQLKIKIKTEFFINWVGSGKNKIGIAIKFCKCYVIKRSSSNLSNKIQLKIKIKTEFFINWVGPGKNKIGIAIKFCKCYVIKRSSNFSNKTQLKKIKIEFFFNQVGPDSMHLALDRTQSGQNSSRNSGE
jgi:Holliday junction resolvase RusA-like endonuclease